MKIINHCLFTGLKNIILFCFPTLYKETTLHAGGLTAFCVYYRHFLLFNVMIAKNVFETHGDNLKDVGSDN